MPRADFRHALVAVIVLLSMFGQGTWALAGTTGALTGTVYDAGTQKPLADAQVTASSPSQTISTKTDATGHFGFISLAPDTYTISVAKDGYEATSQSGHSVFADQTQTVTFTVQKKLKEIGSVTSRAVGDLVKSGTTADVYSVNAAQSERVAALGGGGGLNNAYSAIASVPGVYVPMNQNGYYQTVHIRGGDFDQVGYELDGVPVNRSFDNYPAGTASSLGQQELQIYTGASPANSEGQGLAGYINQVIRTGTYPGFGLIDVGVGGPSYAHKLSAETGGATPNRNFSYYLGVGGYNNDSSRYIDPWNGTAFTQQYGNVINNIGFGTPNGTAPIFAGPNTFFSSGLADRDIVGNLHIGIPHHKDSGKDDVQLLVDSQFLKTAFYDSTNDIGQNVYQAIGNGLPAYFDSAVYTGSVGAPLPSNFGSMFVPYFFPNSPMNRCVNFPGFGALSCASPALIPFDARDTIYNDQEIVKLQYQKNFSSNAYFRIYGYSYYSDWLQNGPQTADANYFGPSGPDYELSTHTRGVSANFADQINAQHLLNIQASYSTASTLRDNNATMFHTGAAAIVDSSNPNNGICYDTSGTPQSCGGLGAPAPLVPGATPPAIAPGAICGSGPCQYYVVENGLNGKYNTVVPKFASASITDQWKPNDKLLVDLGLRWDQFKFEGGSTTGPARAFWFNEFNNNFCINPSTGVPIDKSSIGAGFSPTTACNTIPLPGGGFYATPNLQNRSAQTFTYNVLQPRIAATYTINPDTVIRASFGRYVEPASTAYEQYNTLQQNLADFLGTTFYTFGFTTPGHPVRPSISLNYDLSLEKHIKGTSWSYKLTPFYRKTQDQIENFFLDQKTGFISGLNIGRLTARGVELQVNGGDFAKNGLAGQLALTYTNAYVNYDTLPNGTTIVSQINQNIKNYNAYTSFCATNPADSRCAGASTSSGADAPCYTTSGAPDTLCLAGSVANPYWKAPVQALLDPGANYVPYDIFPGGIGSSAESYNVPYVAALILNYKHNKLAITPSFQFAAGGRYGAPQTVPGVAPDTCTATLGGALDPGRYPFGAPGGAPFDANSCGGQLAAIPNPFTGIFDPPGSFRNPSQLLGHLQIAYEVSPKVTLTATFVNLINRCFGGQVTPFTYNTSSNICSYNTLYSGGSLVNPAGNVYNPCAGNPMLPCDSNGNVFAQFQRFPYEPAFGSVNVDGNSTRQPFGWYLTAHIKL